MGQLFSLDWVEQQLTEHSQPQDNVHSSFIQMIFEKNASAASTEIKMAMNGEPFPSIVTSESNGRLGNQLCAYAAMLYFQEVHGMYAVMGDWQMNMLANVFGKENLKVTTYSVEVPPQFKLNWEMVASPNSGSVWELSGNFLNSLEEYKYNRFINIGLYPHYLFLYKEILDTLRDHLLFKPHVQELVEITLENVEDTNTDSKDIIFVGVHGRMTDYANHLKSVSGATIVDENYFYRAFDIYRSRYNNDSAKVIFMVVSDNPVWMKEKLGSYDDVKFGLDYRDGKLNDTDMPAYDLCLLSACTHSVHTHGTFGTWGSLFAGGDVIAPTGTNPDRKTEDDQIWEKAALPGWLYLDVRDVNDIQEVTFSQPEEDIQIYSTTVEAG